MCIFGSGFRLADQLPFGGYVPPIENPMPPTGGKIPGGRLIVPPRPGRLRAPSAFRGRRALLGQGEWAVPIDLARPSAHQLTARPLGAVWPG